MKIKSLFFTVLLMGLSISSTLAGGSIEWVEASKKIAKDDRDFVKIINHHFKVDEIGSAVRIGTDTPNKGERVAPYTFDAVFIKTGEMYTLVLQPNEDYSITHRYTVQWTPLKK
ncbi:MAG: hypothetical protein SGI98_01945 [Verrucomicrobiota bacterium]|nr:hypothetical protein [Verrucomicrobiota bacterium]